MSEIEKLHDKGREALERKEAQRPPSLIQDPVPASAQVVLEDRIFYRNFAKGSFFVAVIMAALALFLTVALINLYSRPPLTVSYLQDARGNLVTLRPLDQTELTEAEILDWASDRILDLQMVSFADYRDHLVGLRDYFVPAAFAEYQKALISNKTIDRVKNDRLVKYAEPVEAPVLQSMKVKNGVLTWVITMKIREFMAGGEYSSSSTDLEAEITIVRANKTINLDGVRISKYLVNSVGYQK